MVRLLLLLRFFRAAAAFINPMLTSTAQGTWNPQNATWS